MTSGLATVEAGSPPEEAANWALRLFRRSVLKQEKYRQITALLGDTSGQVCLDVGGDNGIISYLLRRRGGEWHSADLDGRTAAAIRALVGERVWQLDGARMPFADASFDLVVIVDYLEHVEDDHGVVRELARIIRPGGSLIVNVPHLKPRSLINRARHAIGLTDARHGHVRPGYDLPGLTRLLAPSFQVTSARTYSRAGSESVDLLLNGLIDLKAAVTGRRQPASRKGTVLTQGDVGHRGEFALLTALYPALWMLSRVDTLLPLQPGYKLIVRAARSAAGAAA